MNYDINIIGNEEDNGKIEFDRLSLLAKSTKDIATKSLMFRFKGFSEINPSKNIKDALKINLEKITGSATEGTKLTLECSKFSETIKTLQLDVFDDKEPLLSMTPMALVIDSFRQALNDESSGIELDKPLLKSLLKFKKNFINKDEIFLLSNRGSIPEIEIKHEDFQRIIKLEDSIPNPQRVIISGKLDEMKVSKGRLGLETNDGIVYIYTNNSEIISNIKEFMGHDLTIHGIAHYKANGGINFVDILSFDKYKSRDKYFNKKPSTHSTNQQLMFSVEKRKLTNSISELLGQWPGEENDDEFSNLIDSLKL
ncbi:hypothetical protein [Chryseobacterium sp. T1]